MLHLNRPVWRLEAYLLAYVVLCCVFYRTQHASSPPARAAVAAEYAALRRDGSTSSASLGTPTSSVARPAVLVQEQRPLPVPPRVDELAPTELPHAPDIGSKPLVVVEDALRAAAASRALWCEAHEVGLSGGFCLKAGTNGNVGGNGVISKEIATALAALFAGARVANLGAGLGQYEAFWERGLASGALAAGPAHVASCDGALNIEVFSLRNASGAPYVAYCDLTAAELDLGGGPASSYDWAMSIEVGEHIPREGEAAFLGHLSAHGARGAVVSWATPGQSGHHHVNCRSHDEVVSLFDALGFAWDEAATLKLRKAATVWWLQKNVYVFRRNSNSKVGEPLEERVPTAPAPAAATAAQPPPQQQLPQPPPPLLEAAPATLAASLHSPAPVRRILTPVTLDAPMADNTTLPRHLFRDAFLVGRVAVFVGEQYDGFYARETTEVTIGLAQEGAPLQGLAEVLHAVPFQWTSPALGDEGDALPLSLAVSVRAAAPFGVVDAVVTLEQSQPAATAHAPAGGDVGMCTNAAPSDVHLLRAWVAYWELLGVSTFYVYWRGPPRDAGALLAGLASDSRADVTVILWPHKKHEEQQVALQSCYARFASHHTFLASYDLDELLVLRGGETLGEFLASFPPTWSALVSDSLWATIDHAALASQWFRLELRHFAAAPFAAISKRSGGRTKWVARTGARNVAPLIEVHELHRGSAHTRGPGGIEGTWDANSALRVGSQFFMPLSRAVHFHLMNAKAEARDTPEMTADAASSSIRALLADAIANLTARRSSATTWPPVFVHPARG